MASYCKAWSTWDIAFYCKWLIQAHMPCRRQAMRVGNAFSQALDSSKPLLFGNFPLDLLQEEQWHPTAARLDPQHPLRLKPDPSPTPANPAHRPEPNQATARQATGSHSGSVSQTPSAKSQSRSPQHETASGTSRSASKSKTVQATPSSSQMGVDATSSSASSPAHQSVAGFRFAGDAVSSSGDAEDKKGGRSMASSWGSDHETDSDDDNDSLEAYDLSEGSDDGKTGFNNQYSNLSPPSPTRSLLKAWSSLVCPGPSHNPTGEDFLFLFNQHSMQELRMQRLCMQETMHAKSNACMRIIIHVMGAYCDQPILAG